MPLVKIIILREDKPNINKSIGDVIDIIPSTRYEGKEVEALKKSYVRVYGDFSQELINALLDGTKSFVKPEENTEIYSALDQNGFIDIQDESILLQYIRDNNA